MRDHFSIWFIQKQRDKIGEVHVATEVGSSASTLCDNNCATSVIISVQATKLWDNTWEPTQGVSTSILWCCEISGFLNNISYAANTFFSYFVHGFGFQEVTKVGSKHRAVPRSFGVCAAFQESRNWLPSFRLKIGAGSLLCLKLVAPFCFV